jgi:hypothetical protein
LKLFKKNECSSALLSVCVVKWGGIFFLLYREPGCRSITFFG